MSKLPYTFDLPPPDYFRKHGWFQSDNTFKFVTWGFARCSTETREIMFDGKKIILKPFQFIFGRLKCSTETNMSEREVRTQQKHMEDSGFIKKSTNKTPSRFTIYEWVLSSFSESKDQVKDQVETKYRPSSDHNQEDKINTDERNDDQLIDKEKPLMKFIHKKHGSIEIEESVIFDHFKNIGYEQEEIFQAINQMKKFNPELNGTIQAYINTILINLQENKKCKKKPKNNSKTESSKPKEAFLGNDLSETPLAQFARQNGLRKK